MLRIEVALNPATTCRPSRPCALAPPRRYNYTGVDSGTAQVQAAPATAHPSSPLGPRPDSPIGGDSEGAAARSEVALLRALSRQPARNAPHALPLDIFDGVDVEPVDATPAAASPETAAGECTERQQHAADLRLAASALDAGAASQAGADERSGGANLLAMLDEMTDLAP